MRRDKDDEMVVAEASATGMPTSPQVPQTTGLPTENPSVPTDYCHMPCYWWNGDGPFTVKGGQTLSLPTNGIFFSPPTTGYGLVRNQIVFCFDLVSGSVSAVIGVTNPSEYNRPMKPYVGVCYPSPTTELKAGQRVMLYRVDIIDQSSMPADIRSWEMNPGASGGSGRNKYPSLAPEVTAVGGDAVIKNIQIEAFAVQL